MAIRSRAASLRSSRPGQSSSRRAAARRGTRLGRPRKVDTVGPDTRTRLLHAASNVFIDRGFESTSLDEIAGRAGVTTAAIYNHFRGKDDLILQSARWALGNALSELHASVSKAPDGSCCTIVRAYMADEFSRTRRLIAEIHLAGLRHRHLGKMVAQWHDEQVHAIASRSEGPVSPSAIKASFLILLGACHLDSLSGLKAPAEDLVALMETGVAAVNKMSASASESAGAERTDAGTPSS